MINFYSIKKLLKYYSVVNSRKKSSKEKFEQLDIRMSKSNKSVSE